MSDNVNVSPGKPPGPGTVRVVFFIDNERFVLEGPVTTPRTILVEFAKEDPSQVTLVSRERGQLVKHTDLDTPFEVKDGTKFTVLHEGPTPVS